MPLIVVRRNFQYFKVTLVTLKYNCVEVNYIFLIKIQNLRKILFMIKEIYRLGLGFLLFTLSSIILSGISPAITIYAISRLIQLFEEKAHLASFNSDITVLVAVIVISVTINMFSENIRYSISSIAAYKLSHNIENIIAEKFQSVTQADLDTPAFLDVYKNATNQARNAPINIIYSLFSAVSSGIKLLGYVIILVPLNFWSLPIFLGFATIIYVLKYKIQTKEFDNIENSTNYFRQIGYLYALISDKQYASEIRLFGLFKFIKNKRDEIFKNIIAKFNEVTFLNICYTTLISVVTLIGMFFLEFWLINKLSYGLVSISNFMLYNSSIVFSLIYTFSFIEQVISTKRYTLFLNFLFKFLDYKSKNLAKINSLTNTKDTFTFEFKNVSFKYPGAKKFSLKNLSLKLKMGEKICLVGENGSGKTTFIKLLLGIYEPTSGKILLNGKDIKSYDLKEYQKLFSVTFQDYIRYLIDVRSNIAFGDITRFDDTDYIEEIAIKTNSKNFIDSYKEKYETKLSKEFYDDGIEPSIGQWQKLAISRAVFRNAPVLILDEPTASLDPKAEEEVFQMFHKIALEKLIIIISHRMCSAKFTDRIILLRQGELIESGTHGELINKKGIYYDLYNLQASKYTL